MEDTQIENAERPVDPSVVAAEPVAATEEYQADSTYESNEPVAAPEYTDDQANAEINRLYGTAQVEESEEQRSAPRIDEGAKNVFHALDNELGEIEELEHDGFYGDITEDHIKELPTVARRILHNFRIDRKKQEARHNKEMSTIRGETEERERLLARSEREFSRRQSEFAALIDDPKVQQILNQPEAEMPDVFTEEGINARIERGIAQGLTTILTPMKQAADQKGRESAYLDFIEGHPEMRSPTFKKQVVEMVRTRAKTGSPVSTQDAYQLVKAQRMIAEQQARSARETRARQQSAKRIGRNVASGTPDSATIPPDVQKRGAHAIAMWLQANPEAAKTIDRQIRS